MSELGSKNIVGVRLGIVLLQQAEVIAKPTPQKNFWKQTFQIPNHSLSMTDNISGFSITEIIVVFVL